MPVAGDGVHHSGVNVERAPDRHLTLYSLLTGAWLCISLTRPALPKSISDIADSPTPETSSTRPRPYLSCVTRSPGSSTSSGRLPAAERAGDGRGLPNIPPPPPDDIRPGADIDGGGSVRRQSMSSCGISRRNRDSGLSIGWPHDERTLARLTYSRCRARVMPT